MKTNCSYLHSINPNFLTSCCMTQLIIMYHKSNNNHLHNQYGILLLKTLNRYLRQHKPLLSNDISLKQFTIFLGILSRYSSIYYYKQLNDYSKLLVKFGLISISQSNFKTRPEIIQLKNSLYNNIASVYINETNYPKADRYINKCFKCLSDNNNVSNDNYGLSKAITYNNTGLIELNENKIASAIKCFKNMYKEIKDYLDIDIDMTKFKPKKILIVFLMYNYCSLMKKYSSQDISSIYNKALNYAKYNIGDNHMFYIKLKEVDNISSDSMLHLSLSSCSISSSSSSISSSSSSSSSSFQTGNNIRSNLCNNTNINQVKEKSKGKELFQFTNSEINKLSRNSEDVIDEEDERYETDEIHNKDTNHRGTFMSLGKNPFIKE